MDFNIVNCSQTELKNIGKPSCEHKLGMTKRLFLTQKDFAFSAKPTLALFQTAIQEKKVFPLTVCQEIEDISKEKQMYEPASGESIVMAQSEKGIRVMLTISPFEFVNLISYDAKQFRIFEYDHLGNLIGCDRDGDGLAFAGFLTSEFSVENMTIPTDRATPSNTPVFIRYADSQEYRTRLATFPNMEFLNTINGLLDVSITVSDVTTSGLTAKVSVVATGKGVSGLHPTSGDDFVIHNHLGDEIAITTCTEIAGGDGEYAITATMPAGTYTIDLLAPASMTTLGYESTGEASFTTTTP